MIRRLFPNSLSPLGILAEFLLGLGTLVAGGWLPVLHSTSALPLALLLLLPGTLLALLPLQGSRHDLWAIPALLVVFFSVPGLSAFFLLPLAVFLFLRHPGLRHPAVVMLLAAAGSLLFSTPQLFWLSDWLSLHVTGFLGSLADRNLQWGDSTGVFLLVFHFAIRLLAGLVLRASRSVLAGTSALLGGLIAMGVWIGSLDVPPANIDLFPLAWFACGMLLLELLLRANPAGTSSFRTRLPGWALPVLAVLGLAIVWHAALPASRASLDGVTIAFREEGDWSWESTREGTRPGPRMGGLLEVLKRWGARVDILKDEELQRRADDYDLVFVIHPTEPLPRELRDTLMEWTDNGGALVLVGEHTNVNDIRSGVNDLLRETSMRLKDDSAIPAWRGWNWNHVQRYLPGPTTRGMRNAQQLGISIGGSLQTGWPAQPMIVGTMAFSDRGNPDNPRGKMGDNHYGWDERFGSIVLVASQARGSGVICAIGDTSGLMSLSTPQVWPFHLNLVRGLLAHPVFGRHPVWPLLGWLLLMVALPLLLADGRVRSLLAWALPASGMLLAAAWVQGSQASPVAVRKEAICWIDYSHLPSFHSSSTMDWSVMSLVEACYNSNKLPLFLWDFDVRQLEGCHWFLVNGSARRWTPRESRQLRTWVENGGRLMIAGDWRRRDALLPLLEELQLDIGDTPLGTAPESRTRQGTPAEFQFYEAWPVMSTEGALDTLISCWDYPIVGMKHIGKGMVSIMGDEHLLTKWSLEGSQRNGRPLNTARRFLDSMQPQQRPTPVAPALRAWMEQYSDSLNRVLTPGPDLPPDRLNKRQQLVYGMFNLPQIHSSTAGQPGGPPRFPGGMRPGGAAGRQTPMPRPQPQPGVTPRTSPPGNSVELPARPTPAGGGTRK